MSRRLALLVVAAACAPVLAVLAVSPASSGTTSHATSHASAPLLPRATSAISRATNAELMPRCPGAQLARAGAQTAAVEGSATDATWDLTDAAWNNVAPDPIPYPVRSEAWTRGCILGAHIEGNVPEGATRDQWYDGKHGKRMGGEVFRVTLTNTPGNYVLFRDTVATDYEDAYDPNGTSPADTMYLDHVQARYIRDDCIENEGDGSPQVPMTVVVRRSLFDGCFSGFAERPVGAGNDSQNGSGGSSLTVDDSMMWIQPQPLGPRYCSAQRAHIGRCRATAQPKVWLGAFGIWKWSRAAAATVTVRNTVFRLDMPSYATCAAQRWPAGTYRNVWVVWTGAGPYATAGGCSNTLPAGVTLTTDARVWDRAKAAWAAGRSPTPLPAPPTATRVFAHETGHRVTGTLTTTAGHPLGGAAVALQRRPAGTNRWATVARSRTNSHGVTRSNVNPRRTSDFRWVFGGDSSHTGARSNPVRVRP